MLRTALGLLAFTLSTTSVEAKTLATRTADSSAAPRVETASSQYHDDDRTTTTLTAAGTYNTRALFGGAGHESGFRLGLTRRQTQFLNPASVVVAEQLGGDNRLVEDTANASYDQGLAVGTSAGVFGGSMHSPLASTRWAGARASQWWLGETLQTTLEGRSTKTQQASPELAADTDGKRIVLPEELTGGNLNLGIMQLTTPTTILKANWSRTRSSDRPDADAVSFEARQYLVPVRAALTAAVSHYENVGSIRPVTTYGTVVANSARLEWGQTLPARLIASAGYRYYVENETPRAADAPRVRLGSDFTHVSLRWRPAAKQWTEDASEIYGLIGRYKTNEPRLGMVVGLGGSWLL